MPRPARGGWLVGLLPETRRWNVSNDDLFGPIEWPEKKRRRTTPKDELENAVKLECLKVFARLQATGQVLLFERRNNLMLPTMDGGMIQAGVPGRADIWAVVVLNRQQQHVEVECKRRKGGTLSPKQKDFRAFCAEQGIPYFVVRSGEELEKNLGKLGVFV